MHIRTLLPLGLTLLALGACEREKAPPAPSAASGAPTAALAPESNPLRDVYFGAVHVHTG